MNISFIVTSFNIAPYILQCLESLKDCVDPGDEVIIVDDGSSDETPDIIDSFVDGGGYGPGVEVNRILLGVNTPGGVGIPANIGMAEATRDAVFFVDGDDWVIPEGFRAARQRFEAEQPDILLGNYQEFDEQAKKSKSPADQARWGDVPTVMPDTARKLALSMIAVPWRKFYRRDFLENHRLRFPEGDFFFEDNPFHWAVCMKAEKILFADQLLCQHRINRPGQTMAANGVQLAAFFTHFDTIAATLDGAGIAKLAPERIAAVEWLLGNVAWHLERLHRSAYWDYAKIAAKTLRGIPEDLWAQACAGRFKGTAVVRAGEQLRKAEPEVVVGLWQGERAQYYAEQINRKVDGLVRSVDALRAEVTQTGVLKALREELAKIQASISKQGVQIHSLVTIAEFEALQATANLADAAPATDEQRLL